MMGPRLVTPTRRNNGVLLQAVHVAEHVTGHRAAFTEPRHGRRSKAQDGVTGVGNNVHLMCNVRPSHQTAPGWCPYAYALTIRSVRPTGSTDRCRIESRWSPTTTRVVVQCTVFTRKRMAIVWATSNLRKHALIGFRCWIAMRASTPNRSRASGRGIHVPCNVLLGAAQDVKHEQVRPRADDHKAAGPHNEMTRRPGSAWHFAVS